MRGHLPPTHCESAQRARESATRFFSPRARFSRCCATTSAEGQTGATEGTFGMFSSPMTGEEFLKKINA